MMWSLKFITTYIYYFHRELMGKKIPYLMEFILIIIDGTPLQILLNEYQYIIKDIINKPAF